MESASAPYYFSADPTFAAMWPAQNTGLWHCLSMLIAGVEVSELAFQSVHKRARLQVLISTLRGLGWPIKSHVASSVDGVADETKLSYFIGDSDKHMILEDDQ